MAASKAKQKLHRLEFVAPLKAGSLRELDEQTPANTKYQWSSHKDTFFVIIKDHLPRLPTDGWVNGHRYKLPRATKTAITTSVCTQRPAGCITLAQVLQRHNNMQPRSVRGQWNRWNWYTENPCNTAQRLTWFVGHKHNMTITLNFLSCISSGILNEFTTSINRRTRC